MNLIISRKIVMTTIFAVAATLIGAILVTSVVGISIPTSTFAQNENVTEGMLPGNVTDGNMTGPDMTGSGVAIPPVVTP